MGGSLSGTSQELSDAEHLAAPSCTVTAGFVTFSPEILSTWSVGTTVWSDRAWTYTRLGSFTTSAFQFKLRTEVDRRKASYLLTAPRTQSVDVYVLGETKAVDAPWAFSAGEPSLDESWCDACESLPEYEAGATYKFDFCRRRLLRAGEAVSFDAISGGKVDIFIKTILLQAKRDWSNAGADLAAEFMAEDEHSRPPLRTAPEGLRHSRFGSNHRGISPPPTEGWKSSETGWDKHPNTSSWLRRTAQNGSPSFLYVPDGTYWADMPGKGLVPVDMCLCALAFLRDSQSTQRLCFSSWKDSIRTVQAWRQRLQLMAAAGADEQSSGAGASSEADVATTNFPVRSAFIAPPALRSSSQSRKRSNSAKRSVSFATPTAGGVKEFSPD